MTIRAVDHSGTRISTPSSGHTAGWRIASPPPTWLIRQGRVDVRLNVIARDMGEYQQIYREKILALPHIAEVEALMLIATIKDSEGLAL